MIMLHAIFTLIHKYFVQHLNEYLQRVLKRILLGFFETFSKTGFHSPRLQASIFFPKCYFFYRIFSDGFCKIINLTFDFRFVSKKNTKLRVHFNVPSKGQAKHKIKKLFWDTLQIDNQIDGQIDSYLLSFKHNLFNLL